MLYPRVCRGKSGVQGPQLASLGSPQNLPAHAAKTDVLHKCFRDYRRYSTVPSTTSVFPPSSPMTTRAPRGVTSYARPRAAPWEDVTTTSLPMVVHNPR